MAVQESWAEGTKVKKEKGSLWGLSIIPREERVDMKPGWVWRISAGRESPESRVGIQGGGPGGVRPRTQTVAPTAGR